MPLPNLCPLCLSDSLLQDVVTTHVYGNIGDKKRAFFKCNKCDVIYLYPGLNKLEQDFFYNSEFEKFMEGRAGSNSSWNTALGHIHANENTRIRRMKYLKKYLKNSQMKILEVGCSSGFMLHPLISSGYRCVGVEPSGIFSDFLRSKKIEVYQTLEELKVKNPKYKFDLIMHFFVLEHIVDPLEFLKSQINMLNDNGKIIFEIPNAADPLYTLYKVPEFEKFYWSIAHPWYFSFNSIKYLLDKLSLHYEIKLDQRYDLSNHIIWARDGRPGGSGKFSPILNEELEDQYKKNLIQAGICDTLVVTIIKNHS